MKGQPLLSNYRKPSISVVYTCLLLLFSFMANGQKLIVQDVDGNALPGVSVYSDGFSFAEITDLDGVVSLTEKAKYPLYFKYLGYEDLSLSKADLEAKEYVIQLVENKLLIEEIVLIGRTDIAQRDLAYESVSIPRAEIQLSNSQTSTDALAANSEVFVQKSQMGGGSPVIRGFEANKLLLVVDGVRLNNAIYRGGHLQNAITIDPAILENMEVIFGPGSLMYGSDALGGVIHFQSKALELTPKTINTLDGSYYARYGSSNNELSIHGDVSIYRKKWASLTSISFADYDDLNIGENRLSKYPAGYGQRPTFVLPSDGTNEDQIIDNDPNLLKFTGYSQVDILQKIRFQPSQNLSFILNAQYSNSSNIPRYDALTETRNGDPRYASWNYGPQQRFLTSLTTKYVPTKSTLIDKIKFIVAYQDINEIRLTRNFQAPIENEQNERLKILNTTLDISRVRGAHQIYTGIDGNYNVLNSTAYENENLGNNTIERKLAGLTRYPNGENNTQSVGVYAQYYYIPKDKKFKINTGLRYDYNRVFTQFVPDNIFTWPSFFYDGVSNTNQSVNWSSGFHYQLPANLKVRALAGSSFRAPNIDDLAKIRLNSNEISIPNTKLTPEKSVNGELSLSYQTKTTEVGMTGFYTYLTDAIVRQNFALPNGNTNYITDGDTFNIVANINAENAVIKGFSFNVRQDFTEHLSFNGSISFTKGDIINDGNLTDPLSHIPPTYAKAMLQYKQEKWLARIGARYNGTKRIDRYGDSTDNPEFATPDGSLSWYTLHFTANYKIHEAFQVQLGVDNILDQFYVPFASGVPGAGRHVSLTLRGNF